jgi:hypothetical protein
MRWFACEFELNMGDRHLHAPVHPRKGPPEALDAMVAIEPGTTPLTGKGRHNGVKAEAL